MALLLDPRAGSGEYREPLSKLGVNVEVTQLPYGDAAWYGDGPGHDIVPVGVEIKKLDELLTCITTKRFSGHQLPGMVDSFQFIYLLVEGLWKCGKEGELLEYRNGGWRPVVHGAKHWQYRTLRHWLTTLKVRRGIHVLECGSMSEGAAALKCEYTWWTGDDFEAHDSDVELDITQVQPRGTSLVRSERRRPTTAVKMAAQLPKIGKDKAWIVADHFKHSVREMVMAGRAEWLEIAGVGPGIADQAMKELR
jgi:ERCC4-type nuclease